MQSSSMGFRQRRSQRKHQIRVRLLKWILALAVIVVAGIYSYETGIRLAEREVTRLEQEISVLSGQIEELTSENRRLEEVERGAKTKIEEWQQRYRQEIPTGELKTLYELTRERLAGGMDSARLAFILNQASDGGGCSDPAETKRFYVKTPIYNGGNDTVSFAKSSIVVTAQGTASIDSTGNQQVRYDPAKPVVVRFARLGGEASEAAGVLPLHHAIVIGDTEYRFSIVAGEPGMLIVTSGECPFP